MPIIVGFGMLIHTKSRRTVFYINSELHPHFRMFNFYKLTIGNNLYLRFINIMSFQYFSFDIWYSLFILSIDLYLKKFTIV